MIICPECSTKNMKGSQFCQNCGLNLNSKVKTQKRISEEIDDVIFTPKKKSKFWLFLIIIILILSASGGLVYFLSQQQESSSPENSVSANSDVDVESPTWEKDINKKYSFPLRDAYGNVISNIDYSVDSVELRKEIIVQGKKATAIEGRQFLIVNISLSNKYSRSIEMNTRDYIRLSVNNSSDWIAPDIHNDPVEIQPLSTKQTRLGFPINTNDSELALQVGELDGTKDIIDLSLQAKSSTNNLTRFEYETPTINTNIESQITPTEQPVDLSTVLAGTWCTNPKEMLNINSIDALGSGKIKINWSTTPRSTTAYHLFYSKSTSGFTYLTALGSSGSYEVGSLPSGDYYFVILTSWSESGGGSGCAASYPKSVNII